MSPVNIVLSYAWYFEKVRFDWSFEITGNLKEYNKKSPKAMLLDQNMQGL